MKRIKPSCSSLPVLQRVSSNSKRLLNSPSRLGITLNSACSTTFSGLFEEPTILTSCRFPNFGAKFTSTFSATSPPIVDVAALTTFSSPDKRPDSSKARLDLPLPYGPVQVKAASLPSATHVDISKSKLLAEEDGTYPSKNDKSASSSSMFTER